MADIDQQRTTWLERAEYFATLIFVRAGVLPWFLLIAVVVFSVTTDNFLSGRNVMQVARQATYLTMVSMGQMVVLLTAGLDLSVGVMFALVSVITSMAMVGAWDGGVASTGAILIGCLAGFGAGTGIGVVNGIGVAVFRVPPFMMTLAMSSIVFGIALIITGGTPIYGMPDTFANVLGYGRGLGVPIPIWITIGFVILMYVFLNWTRMGRYLYALGGNLKASQLSGISTRFYLFMAYVVTAGITTIGAIMLTARLESGEGNIGKEYPLLSIAACVIGGVSLFGGTGRLPNVVLGAIFIILVQNGMNLLRISSYMQLVVIGILLILAVIATTTGRSCCSCSGTSDGGVSLFGGTGRLPNVVLGAIFIILVQNGMNLLRISSYMQLVVIGILLILAVIADNYRQKLLLMLRDLRRFPRHRAGGSLVEAAGCALRRCRAPHGLRTCGDQGRPLLHRP